jgi:hypothetical protein
LGTLDEGGDSPFGLLIPAGVIKEYLARAGVDTSEGLGGNNNNNTVQNSGQSTSSEGVGQQGNTSLLYKNTTLGISLDYPSNWTVESGANMVRFVHFASPDAQFSQTLDVHVFAPGSVSWYQSKDTPLQDVAKGLIDTLNNNLDNFTLLGQRDGPTVDGNPSVLIAYSYNDSNIGTAYSLEAVTLGQTNAYEIDYTAKPDEFKNQLSAFVIVIQSLRAIA